MFLGLPEKNPPGPLKRGSSLIGINLKLMTLNFKFQPTGADMSQDKKASSQKQSIKTDCTPLEPSDLSGSEKHLNRVVVGEIISIDTILQSSGLKDITVDCGDHSYKTVTKIDDLHVGMKTAFALLGATLNNNYVQIQEISGVESHGRLCTAQDLGIGNRSESVVRFPPHLKNGLRLEELVG